MTTGDHSHLCHVTIGWWSFVEPVQRGWVATVIDGVSITREEEREGAGQNGLVICEVSPLVSYAGEV